MTLTNPFLKVAEEASDPETKPAAAALFHVEPPDPDASPEAEVPEPEGLFQTPEASKKDADYSHNPAWKRIVKARDTAVLELAPLKKRLAEIEPIVEAVRKRFEGRRTDGLEDGGISAMHWDASFADTFETLMENDPEVQSVARKVAQVMNGQTPTPTTPPATKLAAVAPADDRVNLLFQRQAQADVEAALKGMGIIPAKLKGMAQYIVKQAADPSGLDESQIVALGRRYIEDTGLTQAELTGETNGKTPRRPASGGSRSATGAAPAAESDEKPEPEFTDRKGYLAFKERMIRSMSPS